MAGLVYVDAETWRYENAGTADLLKVSGNTLTDLPVTKSRTRTAFWQKNRTGIFDIPASKELWIKFDLYYGGSKWRVYDRLNGKDTGIGNYSQNNSITSYINGPLQLEVQPADIIATGSLKTFLLHMVSDATNGLVELWVDGVKLCSEEFADEGLIYSGNVEGGADFENLYLQSDGSTTFYSNVIISNKRIGLGENVVGYGLTQSLVFDAERQLETHGTLIFDVERRILDAVHVSASFDVSREVVRYWRYYNLGDAIYLITPATAITNLPADKSKTGIAFYNPTREKCFDIPAAPSELWVKFDVYTTDLSETWRALCDDGNTLFGIRSYDDGALGVFLYKTTTRLIVYDAIKAGELQTFLLHITASTVEVWVDGGGSNSYSNKKGSAKVWIDGDHRYSRDTDTITYVATRGDFYLQSNGEGTFFSNVIISDRQIGFDEGAQRFTCDVECIIQNAANFSADLVREVMAPIIIQQAFDVHCTVIKDTASSFDVIAVIVYTLIFDTERQPLLHELFHCDIARQIPHGLIITPINLPEEQLDTTGVQSITIDLAAQQLTDQLSFTWIHPAEILQQIRGQYLDYKFDMRIEDTTEIGILTTCYCCSDIDELLYTQAQLGAKPPSGLMTVEEAEIWHAQENAWYLEYFGVPKYLDDPTPEALSQIPVILKSAAKKIEVLAKIFGKNWVILFEDFSSTVFFGRGISYTFGDMIRELFGWTSRVPNLMINCYIRGDTIYAVQRGHEENVIDLTGTKHTIPVKHKNIMRLAWGSDETSYTITTTEPVYTPDEELDADAAAKAEPTNDDSITNEYGDDNLVKKTTIRDENITTVIDYEYRTSDNRKYLYRESTTVTDNNTGATIEEREVIHEHLAGGSSGQGLNVARDEDGETTASAVGQKPFTEKPTPWAKHAYMNGKWHTLTGVEEKEVTIKGHALVDTSLPVTDFATKKKFTEAINWLNRKTQETVSMDVYDYPHVIDFNDRIILNGATYFLESNSVVKTPRIMNKQSVKFVRWY